MAESTRERVVTAAVELFNEGSVAQVTTNHIAQHLGISPGNLYYHFANKEEIIRAAFDRMNAAADALWEADGVASSRVDVAALQRIVLGNLRLYAEYIFFARELIVLLRADPVLRERYSAVSERRMTQLVAVLRPLVDTGLLRDVGDEDDLRALAESAWLIGLFCVPYAETAQAGEGPRKRTAKAKAAASKAAVERGALLVLHLFKPYMEPLAYTALVVLVRSQLEG